MLGAKIKHRPLSKYALTLDAKDKDNVSTNMTRPAPIQMNYSTINDALNESLHKVNGRNLIGNKN